jgi:hypothetical protein
MTGPIAGRRSAGREGDSAERHRLELVKDVLARALIAADINPGFSTVTSIRVVAAGLIPNDALALSVIGQARDVVQGTAERLYDEPLHVAEQRYTNATVRILQAAVWGWSGANAG